VVKPARSLNFTGAEIDSPSKKRKRPLFRTGGSLSILTSFAEASAQAYGSYLPGLRAFANVDQLEAHQLTFSQVAVAAAIDGRVMDKNIIPAFCVYNEAISFQPIEPLYGSRALYHVKYLHVTASWFDDCRQAWRFSSPGEYYPVRRTFECERSQPAALYRGQPGRI
jgi:hypothetical protein